MPKRGEVWIVDLGMAQKVRPALVLNRAYADSDRDLISIVPHITTLRESEFEIVIAVPFLRPGAFLVQHPITVPAAKAERLLGCLTPPQLALVEAGVRDWLGL